MNDIISMVHVMEMNKGDLKRCIIYIPEKQALFECNLLTAKIVHEYFNLHKNIDSISSMWNQPKDRIETIIHEIEALNVNKNGPIDLLTKRNNLEIMINLVHDCNFRCEYCYANRGTYGLDKSTMEKSVGLRCLEFFNKNYENTDIHCLFFGGEPLLNYGVLCNICEKAQEINFIGKHHNRFSFRVITNGSIITDEMIALFKTHNVGVTLSIDGPPMIHDELRKYVNGEGSYKDIVQNLKRLKKVYPDCSIFYEATYTKVHEKHGWTRDNVREYLKEELHLNHGSIVDAFIAKGISKDIVPSKKGEQPIDILEKGYLLGSSLIYPLSYFVCKQKTKHVCNIGLMHFSVTPNGDIYPCQLFIGENALVLGNVQQENWDEKKTSVLTMLSSFNKEESHKCKMCWAKYLCKDCPGGAFHETGKLEMPDEYCIRIRNNAEKLLLALAEIRKNPMRWKHFCERVNSYKNLISEFDFYA